MCKKKLGWRLVCVLLLLPLFGCPMYTAVGFKYAESSDGGGDEQPAGDDPVEIETSEDTITIAWDAPSSDIDYYRVMFRIHGTTEPWYTIVENLDADPNPEYPVNRVGSGVFDFGVVAKDLDADTEESDTHTSIDITAQPDTGWYVIWLD